MQSATLDWSGGQPHTAIAHHIRLKSNDPISIILDRTPGKDLRLTVDAGGNDRLFVPYAPQIEISEQAHEASTRQYKLETDELGHNEGLEVDCVLAPMDGVIDPSSAAVAIDTLAGGPTDSTTYARITKRDAAEICSTGFLRPLEGSPWWRSCMACHLQDDHVFLPRGAAIVDITGPNGLF